MHDIDRGLFLLDTSHYSYVKAQQYAANTIPEIFASRTLQRRLAQYHGLRLNFASTVIETLASRLEIQSVTCPEQPTLNAVLDQIWQDNMLLLESPVVDRRTLEYGDYYAIVEPVEDELGRITGAQINFNSPLTTAIVYNPADPRKVDYAIKKWQLGPYVRVNLYYEDRLEKYISDKEATVDSDHISYVAYAEDNTSNDLEDQGVIFHEFGQVPVFHFRVGTRPYGTPEHINAYGPQDAINKLVASDMDAVDYSLGPLRVILAEGGNKAPASASDDDWDDETVVDASNKNPQLPTRNNSVWWFDNVKDVKEFKPADPDVFLKRLDFHIRSMALLTQTPAHYFFPSGDAPSGESLRAAEAPLNKKARDRQQQLGSTWAELMGFCLKILGFGDVHVDIRWAQPGTTVDKEYWDAVNAKIAAAPESARPYVARQCFLEAGYSEDQLSQMGFAEFLDPAAEPSAPESDPLQTSPDPLAAPPGKEDTL